MLRRDCCECTRSEAGVDACADAAFAMAVSFLRRQGFHWIRTRPSPSYRSRLNDEAASIAADRARRRLDAGAVRVRRLRARMLFHEGVYVL